MKDIIVETRLKKLAKRFQNAKKFKPEKLVDHVVEAMMPIGGITGFNVVSHGTMTLHNHSDRYNLPIRYEEHSERLSSFGKRAYTFLERLQDHLMDDGISPRNIEYHLGKAYSTKHHDPR